MLARSKSGSQLQQVGRKYWSRDHEKGPTVKQGSKDTDTSHDIEYERAILFTIEP